MVAQSKEYAECYLLYTRSLTYVTFIPVSALDPPYCHLVSGALLVTDSALALPVTSLSELLFRVAWISGSALTPGNLWPWKHSKLMGTRRICFYTIASPEPWRPLKNGV